MWLELLHQHASLVNAIAVTLGLIVGSFLNVVIYRLPLMQHRALRRQEMELADAGVPPSDPAQDMSLLFPRSHCPQCRSPIPPKDNIPCISYLLRRGRCRFCGEAIGIRYPLVEFLCAIVTVLVFWRFETGAELFPALVFGWGLLTMSAIDIDHLLLPDNLTLPLLWLGLIVNSFDVFTDTRSAVYGAAAGYLSLWMIFHAFKAVTGKEGMGYGDFKLLAGIGAWLGWQQLLPVLVLSSTAGVLIGVIGIIFGRNRNQPIPFGPFLSISAFVVLLWGGNIVDWKVLYP